MSRSEYTSGVTRLYTKSGGGLIVTDDGRIDYNQIRDLSEDISSLYKDGTDILLVSSGAMVCGRDVLGIPMNDDLDEDDMRLVASAGQHELMSVYKEHLKPVIPGQALISSKDLSDEYNKNRIIGLYDKARARGMIIIINNNDTVNDEEVRYSENDELYADLVITFEKLRASEKPLCVILSKNALRESKHPDSPEIPYVNGIDDYIKKLVWEHNGNHTFGGMGAKLEAIERITEAGYPVILVDGKYSRTGPGILKRILEGEEMGTFFEPQVNSPIPDKSL